MKVGARIYVIEDYTINEYRISLITVMYYYYVDTEGKRKSISKTRVNSDKESRHFFSYKVAIDILKERLERAIKEINIDIEKHKVDYQTKNISKFRESCKDLADIFIEKELTSTRFEEVQEEINNTIVKELRFKNSYKK